MKWITIIFMLFAVGVTIDSVHEYNKKLDRNERAEKYLDRINMYIEEQSKLLEHLCANSYGGTQ